jgi:hypothetical protein
MLCAMCYILTVLKLALSFIHTFLHSPINYCYRIRIVFLCTGAMCFSTFNGVLLNNVFLGERVLGSGSCLRTCVRFSVKASAQI